MFALASMLLATGCSQEEEIVNSSNDYVEASFTVDLGNEVQSRSLGEADLVNQLYYGIYQDGKVIPVITNVDNAAGNFNTVSVGEAEVKNRQATVKMRLVKGQTYDFVFWAQVKDNKHYNINMNDLQNITVNYNGDANDETRDAFFARELGYTVQSHFTKTITLKRPFAQLNVGTTKADFEAARILLGGSPITQSNLIVTKIPTSLNLLSGKVGTDATANAEFKMAFLPKEDDAYTQNGYDILKADVDGNKEYSLDEEFAHLSMNYLLAAERTDAELSEVSVEFANAKGSINTIKVSQLPVYRNYRTNILGNILTSNGEFTIIVDAAFEQEEIIRELWDGESTEAVTAKNENGVSVYEIANAKQLAWVAEQVNSGENTFAGAIVRLTADIYLNNQPWTPIGLGDGGNVNTGEADAKAFQGTFDGKDFTVYELNIVAEAVSRSLKEGDKLPAGLFGKLNKGTIKNLTVNGAQVNHIVAQDGGGVAVVAGIIFPSGTIEGVTVKNAFVEGNRYVGGIAGFVYGNIKNCIVENVKLTATPDNLTGKYDNGDKVGGIAGSFFSENKYELSGNTITNVTVTGYRDLGGIAGAADAKKVSGNVVTGVVITVDRTDEEKNYNSSKATNAGVCVGSYLNGSKESDLSNNTSSETTIIGNTDSESAVVTSQEEFNSAIAAGATEIAVVGEVKLTNISGNEITIVGVGENAVVDRSGTPNMGGGTLNFKNITIKGTSANYQGLQNIAEEYYTDCTIDNQIFLYGKAHFVNCTFNQTSADLYNVWTYGSNEVIFENCTFNSAGKSVLVYNEGACGTNATFIDCTFKASQSVDGKAAIEIDGTLLKNEDIHVINVNNTTATGFAAGSVSGNSLWNDEKSDRSIINVDGNVVAYADIDAVTEKVLKMEAKSIVLNLVDNVTIKGQTSAYAAENITINGNNKTLTFSDSYRTYIKTAGGKVVLNNVIVSRQSTGGTHWHDNNMKFSSDVEMNNVTFDKGITINEVKAVLNNVTITKTKVATYGLFIVCGSNVEMDDCKITHADGVAGRGIKVVTEDASNKTADTYLKVSNTSFSTEEKAAILAVSEGGLIDIEINNIDITNVKEDNVYAVWVDEDAAAHADKVRVVGGKVKIEGQFADGVSLKNNIYSISSANGMLWFANEVNVNGNDFAGKTVELVANIDLKGIDWEPIGQIGATQFQGTFDGQDYTISNLSVDSEAETGAHYSSGLFGWLNAATVIDVKVNVASIKGHHNCGVIAGYLETSGCTVSNCHVTNAEVICTHANADACGDKAGTVVGHAGNAGVAVEDCTAKNSTVKAGRDAGQVVGAGKQANVKGCSAENVKVSATNDCTDSSAGKNINESVIGRVL